jgi:hypothetical protein
MCSLAISCVFAMLANIQFRFEQSVRTLLLEPIQKMLNWRGPTWKLNIFNLAILCVAWKFAKIPNVF